MAKDYCPEGKKKKKSPSLVGGRTGRARGKVFRKFGHQSEGGKRMEIAKGRKSRTRWGGKAW